MLKEKVLTLMGFEPTRAEHIGLAVQRLNHSASDPVVVRIKSIYLILTPSRHYLKHFTIFLGTNCVHEITFTLKTNCMGVPIGNKNPIGNSIDSF